MKNNSNDMVEDIISCLKSKKFTPYENGYIRKLNFGDIFVDIDEKGKKISYLFYTIKNGEIFQIKQTDGLRIMPNFHISDWINYRLAKLCEEYIHQELFEID